MPIILCWRYCRINRQANYICLRLGLRTAKLFCPCRRGRFTSWRSQRSLVLPGGRNHLLFFRCFFVLSFIFVVPFPGRSWVQPFSLPFFSSLGLCLAHFSSSAACFGCLPVSPGCLTGLPGADVPQWFVTTSACTPTYKLPTTFLHKVL